MADDRVDELSILVYHHLNLKFPLLYTARIRGRMLRAITTENRPYRNRPYGFRILRRLHPELTTRHSDCYYWPRFGWMSSYIYMPFIILVCTKIWLKFYFFYYVWWLVYNVSIFKFFWWRTKEIVSFIAHMCSKTRLYDKHQLTDSIAAHSWKSK